MTLIFIISSLEKTNQVLQGHVRLKLLKAEKMSIQGVPKVNFKKSVAETSNTLICPYVLYILFIQGLRKGNKVK